MLRMSLLRFVATPARALLLVVTCTAPVVVTTDDPNIGFDSEGRVTTTIGSIDSTVGSIDSTVRSNDEAHTLALQADGKVLVAGSSDRGLGSDFALVRYNPDGSLDPTFGTDGKVTTRIGEGTAQVSALAVQTDGKVIAAGSAGRRFALVRYNPDGSLDTSFGTGGTVTARFDGNEASEDTVQAVALQPNGKIVVAGKTSRLVSGERLPSPSLRDSCAIARYNPDGSRDASFGMNGVELTSVGIGSAWVQALALQPDGKLVVSGYSAEGGILIRYNPDGSVDTSFDKNGTVTSHIGEYGGVGQAIALQTDSKIVAAGSAGSGFALARYNPDGSLDASFGAGGTVTSPAIGNGVDFATTLAVQRDGKIVVAGYSAYNPQYDFVMARYNTDGSMDTSFGTDGKVLRDNDSGAVALAIQADSKVVVVKGSPPGTDSDFVVLRYDVNGKPDSGFGSGGTVETNLSVSTDTGSCETPVPPFSGWLRGNGEEEWSSSAAASALVLQADGKVVVAGNAGRSVAMARYNPDGSLDSGFGQEGEVTSRIGVNERSGNAVHALALQADRKIVVVGQSWNGISNDFALARYNPDGSLDASFGVDGKVTTDFTPKGTPPGFSRGYDEAFAIVTQTDGKITAAGQAAIPLAFSSPQAAPRGSDGMTGMDRAWGGLRPFRRRSAGFALVRYKPDGSLDASFGADGKVTTDFNTGPSEAHALSLQRDGKIVAAGKTSYNNGLNSAFALARYNPDGSLDTSFGTDGIVTTRIGTVDSADAIALQLDGKIVVVGVSYSGPTMGFAVVRYNSDGSLDSKFGREGKTVTTMSAGSDEAHSYGPQYFYGRVSGGIALQADGKIVVAGSADNGFVLLRYNPHGRLDTSFGESGKVTTRIGATRDSANALALQPDGKIVVAGACTNARHSNFAVIRYDSDGRLDPTFGVGGKVTTRMGNISG